MQVNENKFRIIQIVPAPSGYYIWDVVEGRTFVDPVPAFGLVEFPDGSRRCFPLIVYGNKMELGLPSSGVLEYRPKAYQDLPVNR